MVESTRISVRCILLCMLFVCGLFKTSDVCKNYENTMILVLIYSHDSKNVYLKYIHVHVFIFISSSASGFSSLAYYLTDNRRKSGPRSHTPKSLVNISYQSTTILNNSAVFTNNAMCKKYIHTCNLVPQPESTWKIA